MAVEDQDKNSERTESTCTKRTNLFRFCLYIVILMLVIEVLVSLSVHKKTYRLLQRMRVVQNDASVISEKLGIISNYFAATEITTSPIQELSGEVLSMEFYFQKCDYLNKHNVQVENYTEFKNCSILCPEKPPKLVGPLATYKESPSYEQIEKIYPNLEPGGRFSPSECVPRHRTAVVIPFRKREQHLRTFLYNIHPFLQRQQLDYGIYVVDQAEGSRFNRALLMNIGFAEAMKIHNYTCFVFHDVDLIPENDENIYGCYGQPRHMSAAVDKFQYRLPYSSIFGGVSAISRTEFEKVNGFSNVYFGWGGEDDDMWNRLGHHGYKVVRYPMKIARYRMISHGRDKANEPNNQRMRLLREGKMRFKTDGLNSLRYKVLKLEFNKLYTRIHVEVNEKEIMKG